LDARTTFINLDEAVFTLNFDSTEPKRSSRLWYCLPMLGFCDELVGSKTEGLILQAVIRAIKGRFRYIGTFKSYTEPDNSINGAMMNPKCWVDESVYKAKAGVDSSGWEIMVPYYYRLII
jgi:hypothetical protein